MMKILCPMLIGFQIAYVVVAANIFAILLGITLLGKIGLLPTIRHY